MQLLHVRRMLFELTPLHLFFFHSPNILRPIGVSRSRSGERVQAVPHAVSSKTSDISDGGFAMRKGAGEKKRRGG